jgi:hypothetical protein
MSSKHKLPISEGAARPQLSWTIYCTEIAYAEVHHMSSADNHSVDVDALLISSSFTGERRWAAPPRAKSKISIDKMPDKLSLYGPWLWFPRPISAHGQMYTN